MRKAIVVLSGGQDSTTCLFEAKTRFDEVHALTFDYNQRHSLEIEAAKKIAEMANVASHEIVKIGPILTGRSFLTDLNADVQKFSSFKEMDRSNTNKEDKLDSSFVPMRNPLFLTIAANRAFAKECTSLITGVTAADFAEYGGFSWEWLGGFVDAEGHFSVINGDGYRLSISQKDPELLHRIGNWITEQFPNITYSVGLHNPGAAQLYLSKKACDTIASSLTPHLHSPHRRNQAATRGIKLSQEESITDSYVTGFWEGDGSCGGQIVPTRTKKGVTRQFKFDFYQKDPEVLEKIHNYLGLGTIYQRNTQNQIWVLTVSDGPLSSKLLRRMRPYMNVLHSFEKLAKARHKIDLPAGGFNPPYPDCTPDFIYATQKVIDESLRSPFISRVKIETPLMYLTKSESCLLAKSLPGAMEALAYSHTCYSGVYPPCNECHACLLRAHGFEQAGVSDPLIVRATSNP